MILTQTHNIVDAFLAFPFIRSLDPFYPNIMSWYINSVIPNLASGRDTLLLAKDHGELVGLALGKRSPEESKLRCIRVADSWQGRGVGIHLIDAMLELLETEEPVCTVSEELFHQYSRAFVSRYGFRLSNVVKGQYRPGKLEYQFN